MNFKALGWTDFGIGETDFTVPSKWCLDKGGNFVACFTIATLRKKHHPQQTSLGFFWFCCPYFSVLHTSLILRSYRVACLQLLSAPCPSGSFQYRKRFIWRPTPGSACASLHKTNIQSGVTLSCLHRSLGGERRGVAEQRYCMEIGQCLGKLSRAFLH